MQIGRNLYLSSAPVVSHLITEATGTLVIGDDVTIGFGAAIYCEKEVRIGDGTTLAPYCVIADTDFHVIGDSARRPQPKPIMIGSRVQIGARVSIMPGSSIGDGAVVAAGSTVAGSIPAGAVVSGVPAAIQAGPGAREGDIPARVLRLVRDALGLLEAPGEDVPRSSIPEWDSLGALRIALGAEGAFAISLTERDVTQIHSVGDLIRLVTAKAESNPPN